MWKLVRGVLPILCLFALFFGMRSEGQQGAEESLYLGALPLLGQQEIMLLQGDTKVFRYLVTADPYHVSLDNGSRVEVSESKAQQLRKWLLRKSTYEEESMKSTPFVPEMAFVFEGENCQGIVFVSLSCQQVLFDLGPLASFLHDVRSFSPEVLALHASLL